MGDYQTVVLIFIFLVLLITNLNHQRNFPRVNLKKWIEAETKTFSDREKQRRIQLGLEPLFTSQTTKEDGGKA